LSTGGYSFTHRERLLTARQFQAVFNNASKTSCELFTVLYKQNALGYPRIGIVVAKRNAKRAVDRNYIKRAIRETFRCNKVKLPANDYVVILKRSNKLVKMSLQRSKIRQQLLDVWQAIAVKK